MVVVGIIVDIMISFQVDLDFVGGDVVNYVEISVVFNVFGLVDVDFEFDQVNNDLGGLLNSLVDNYIFGDGMGVVNSGDVVGDVDDYDFVLIVVIVLVDLSLIKMVDNDMLFVGEEVIYMLMLINDGLVIVINMVVEDVFFFGLIYVSYSGGSYNEVIGEWIVVSLVAGESVSLDIIVFVEVDGDYNNCM